jgi:hypothetical protein
MMVDTNEYDRFQDEESFLHHLITERKRQHQPKIQKLCDTNGSFQHTSTDILRAFAEHYRQKYDTIPIQAEAMDALLGCNMSQILDDTNAQLVEPISIDELHHAIQAGKSQKSPDYDGIVHSHAEKSVGGFFLSPEPEVT